MYLISDFKEKNYFAMLIVFFIINDFHLNLDCVGEGSEWTPLFKEPNAESINTEDQPSDQAKNVTSAENPQGQFIVISLMVKCSCTSKYSSKVMLNCFNKTNHFIK